MRGALAWASLGVGGWALPGAASAQEGCAFGRDGNDVLRQVTLAGGESIFYVTRPHFVCQDGVQIWADSATAYTSNDLAHLIGSVRYVDRARELRSDEARYFSNVGRLQATGNLFIRDLDQGSVVEDGDLVYLRRTGFRSEETMTVTTGRDQVRPVATITAQRAEAGTPGSGPDVYVVEGDEIELRGGAYLRSTGSVVFRFDSVQAFADTLEFEEASERVRLLGAARVEAETYDLVGTEIVMTAPRPAAREIRATGEAVLTGEDLLLTAPLIHLFAEEERLERLVALPAVPADSAAARADSAAAPTDSVDIRRAPTPVPLDDADRPHAVADRFEITADSLEVLAPDEALERIFAAGRARSVSHARDSLNGPSVPDVARSDWLEGDTIIVTFVPDSARAGAADSTRRAVDSTGLTADAPIPDSLAAEPGRSAGEDGRRRRIERIVALVSARSLYRLPASATGATAPSDGSADNDAPPAVHYVVGDRITVLMGEDDVDRLQVEGQAVGVHLEPLPTQGVPDGEPTPPPPGPAGAPPP